MLKYRHSSGIFYAILNSMTVALRPAVLAISALGKRKKGCAKAIAPKEEGARLSFVVLADVHLTAGQWRTGKFCKALKDIESAKKPLDAFVTLGDNTDHGEIEHWERVKAVLGEFDVEKKVLAIGNHDTWGHCPRGKDGGKFAVQTYVKYRNEICGESAQTPYYSTVVKGYTFIALASESDSLNADISDEQIAWLDAELKKATADGKPVFVLCHQAINKTHGLPATFGDKEYEEMTGGIGEKSDEVLAILQKYKNVFYMSGHSHMGLQNKSETFGTFEKIGNIFSINEPCFMFRNHDGLPNSGIGLIFDVYDDHVSIRVRSHIWHVWYNGFEEKVEIR